MCVQSRCWTTWKRFDTNFPFFICVEAIKKPPDDVIGDGVPNDVGFPFQKFESSTIAQFTRDYLANGVNGANITIAMKSHMDYLLAYLRLTLAQRQGYAYFDSKYFVRGNRMANITIAIYIIRSDIGFDWHRLVYI